MFSAVCGSVCVAFPDKTRENDENRFATKICFHCTLKQWRARHFSSQFRNAILPSSAANCCAVVGASLVFLLFFFLRPQSTPLLWQNLLVYWPIFYIDSIHLRFVVFDSIVFGAVSTEHQSATPWHMRFQRHNHNQVAITTAYCLFYFYFAASFYCRCLRFEWKTHFIV